MLADSGRPRATRVVVTGLGVVTPIGTDVRSFWRAALDGRVGTGPLTRFETRWFSCRNGGEIRGFDLADHLDGVPPATPLARCTELALAAVGQSLDDAGVRERVRGSARAGVCFASVMGPRPELEKTLDRWRSLGDPTRRDPGEIRGLDPAEISRVPARHFGLAGPNRSIMTTCAAGSSAVGCAMDLIRAGDADVMVAGGTEQLSIQVFSMFDRMDALSAGAVSPFARRRDGLLLSEGAAALVLERHDRARARGARIYCEILGHGNCTDAYHLTAPDPEGLGASRAMQAALHAAGVDASRVAFISAHGTGTPLNDAAEARAIARVFGDRARSIPVTALKSLIGHTSGAAGAVQTVAAALSVHEGIVPPTANTDELDPDCQVHLITGAPHRAPIEVAISNAFGFGGCNESLVLGAAESCP